jgi:predicted HicB family RNase H-like nuclease
MTAQYAFDTLAFVKRLSAAGMETPHAKALAEALVDSAFDNLATKSDLRELQAATKADLRELQAATDAKLRELEHSLTNKLTVRMGAMTAATIAIIGALKIFS